jgi:predicted ATPase
MRRLHRKWVGGTGWPKRLEWIEVSGLRGWSGQRVRFQFPIVAIVGENGSGKSTLLQAAACVYQIEEGSTDNWYYPSEFFPETAWDQIRDVTISYGYSEGTTHIENSIRKPTTRWLGHGDRPIRTVEYIDLNRIQPVAARVGYARIAKNKHIEKSSKAFDTHQLQRLSEVMGREYVAAKMALSDIDETREIPVLTQQESAYSGYHQGSGETTIAELLRAELPRRGLMLIDEIESSLHPRAQRRLIRDLADQCRDRDLQIILTTHSPYVLEELPLEARLYILETKDTKQVVPGVSPQFAMTKMDDEAHPECDLYVEDVAAKILLSELLSFHGKEFFPRCQIIPFGASNVGHSLGQMVEHNRFPRPTRVFLDGDNAEAPGCILLPGGDAPEQVVFKSLRKERWGNLWTRVSRDVSLVTDACNNAMLLGDHHEWVRFAANQLMCGAEPLWQAMCAEWAQRFPREDAARIVNPIGDAMRS